MPEIKLNINKSEDGKININTTGINSNGESIEQSLDNMVKISTVNRTEFMNDQEKKGQ